MKWICLKPVTALVLLFISIQSYSISNSMILYGLTGTQHFQSNFSGEFYIQLASFKNKSNAYKLLKKSRLQTNYPVTLRQKQGVYIVILGPIPSAEGVRAASRDLASPGGAYKKSTPPDLLVQEQQSDLVPVKQRSLAVDKDLTPRQGNWYLGVGGGVQATEVNDSLNVANGSGFPAPYNLDSLSTKTQSSALLGVEGGYRWQRDNLWLPAYSLGLRYKHLFSTDIGNQVIQYSTPEFTNYNYHWKISSDALLLSTKLNLFQSGYFLPYLNGGIGVAFNHTSSYSEAALTGVTPRISPAFSNHDKTAFTYILGAGVDWQPYPQFIMSLGYEFQDLGNLSSGNGAGVWSQSALYSGSFQSNAAVLSISYLIGN